MASADQNGVISPLLSSHPHLCPVFLAVFHPRSWLRFGYSEVLFQISNSGVPMSDQNKPTRGRRPAGKDPVRPHSYCCRKKFDKVYQFEIALQEIEPTLWRRIQVPEGYSFWDLHCAITDCLGWLDYHLHQFNVKNPETGQPENIGIDDYDGFDDYEVLPDWETKIANYFTAEHTTCDYEYDFGDGWHHAIILEEILPREEGVVYPRCIAGERACPPEDVGGPWGYERFLKSIAYMNSPGHDRLLEWVGGWFDPEWFDLDLIRFGNPESRRRVAFEEQPIPRTMRTVQYHLMKR